MDERLIVGPLFTHAGFQSWFFVCFPGSIVAVPMGFWFAITANKAATLFVGGAAGATIAGVGEKTQSKHVARLMQLSEDQLAGQEGSATYPIGELSAIVFKRRVFSSPEVIVVNRNGRRRIFGIMNLTDQAAIVDALVERYGPLTRKE